VDEAEAASSLPPQRTLNARMLDPWILESKHVASHMVSHMLQSSLSRPAALLRVALTQAVSFAVHIGVVSVASENGRLTRYAEKDWTPTMARSPAAARKEASDTPCCSGASCNRRQKLKAVYHIIVSSAWVQALSTWNSEGQRASLYRARPCTSC
jgi:hypothetical protein